MEGLYGSICAPDTERIFTVMRDTCGLGPTSHLIDIGAGLGRPLLHAAITMAVASTHGLELDSIKCLKAGAFLRNVTLAAVRSKLCPANLPLPVMSCTPIEKTACLDPGTHAYSFWEGIPADARVAFGLLFASSRTMQCVAVVQRGMRTADPAAVMEEDYGFGPLTLVDTFPVQMSGSRQTFRAYIFKKRREEQVMEGHHRRVPAAEAAGAVRTPSLDSELALLCGSSEEEGVSEPTTRRKSRYNSNITINRRRDRHSGSTGEEATSQEQVMALTLGRPQRASSKRARELLHALALDMQPSAKDADVEGSGRETGGEGGVEEAVDMPAPRRKRARSSGQRAHAQPYMAAVAGVGGSSEKRATQHAQEQKAAKERASKVDRGVPAAHATRSGVIPREVAAGKSGPAQRVTRSRVTQECTTPAEPLKEAKTGLANVAKERKAARSAAKDQLKQSPLGEPSGTHQRRRSTASLPKPFRNSAKSLVSASPVLNASASKGKGSAGAGGREARGLLGGLGSGQVGAVVMDLFSGSPYRATRHAVKEVLGF